MSDMRPPRLELRHWSAPLPVVLVWIADLGVMAWVVGGDREIPFSHDFTLVELSDERAAELLAMHGVPTRRDLESRSARTVIEADIAWKLSDLLHRCLRDFGMHDAKVWHGARRSMSLQRLYGKTNPGAGMLCRRDADCRGGDDDHAWLMAQPAGIKPPFFIWHIGLRHGNITPPTPLRIE